MAIIVDHVSHVYGGDTSLSVKALNDISLVIPDGQFIGLIGHTGSGKSTLVQHLNGLLKATSGSIYFNGQDIDDEDYNRKELRSKVGLVFQYPETAFISPLSICREDRKEGWQLQVFWL